MGIFCLPTSAAIPLHNHPGMTVFSRLLYGSMHVRSYDWVNPFSELSGDASTPRLAKLVADHVLTAPCESAVLFPASGGNIHAFTALTPCAVLDVLTPPYSPIDARHCIYYRESKFCGYPHDSTESEQELDLQEPIYVWLEESQPSSDDFVIQEGFYKGPKIKP
ncbi:hypothetical protein O6H91_02G133700 [Diphasiastrum complanatum]|nr:hypothetical protein O6H91_02G133700 [Diphasiastrum complanatum]